jgi:hypothetical protein
MARDLMDFPGKRFHRFRVSEFIHVFHEEGLSLF